MLGAAGDIDFRVADEARERSRDEGARVTGGGDVGVVEHRMAEAADFPVRARLGLGEQRDDARPLIRPQLALRLQAQLGKSRPHRIDVDGVAHQAMANSQRSGPVVSGAEHDDFVIEEFHAGGSRSARREQRPVAADRFVRDAGAIDLAEGDRDSERGSGARKTHGLQAVPGRRGQSTRLDIGDPVGREQRALDLDEVDVIRGAEARIRHRGAYARGDVVDLSQAPEAFEGKLRGARMANGERARFRRRRDVAGFEDHEMRREGSLRPAGHHELDRLTGVARPAPGSMSCNARTARPREKSLTQPLPSVLPKMATIDAGSIAPAAMAASSPETSSGRAHRDAMDEGLPRQGRASMKAFDVATAPNTPPCIVTILSAAA